MDALDIARWQFGITTVYHFLFVPITIGLSAIVAGCETAWVRTGNEQYLRLTKFFGKLFLINFAMGVVTGIVQEFQFGMNWSDYSRFVGDIFGAPLAIEGLLAFFLESTFLGCGSSAGTGCRRGCTSPASGWSHVGTLLSAYFILAANSWMQHPVGYAFNPETGRAELTDFLAVLTNKVQLVTFPHTITAAFLTGGAFVVGVAVWHLMRQRTPDDDRPMYRTRAADRRWVTLVAGLGVAVTGDIQGKVMTEVQPMKMAAAEALYDTEQPAAFSIFTIGTPRRHRGEVRGQDPGPAVLPRHRHASTARSRASTSCASSTRRPTARTRARRTTPRRLHARTSRSPTGRFRLMIGFGVAGRGSAPRWSSGSTRRGRAPTGQAAGCGWPSPLPLLPLARQLLRLDLHRDGPPALGRLRPDDDGQRRSPPASARPRCSPR